MGNYLVTRVTYGGEPIYIAVYMAVYIALHIYLYIHIPNGIMGN